MDVCLLLMPDAQSDSVVLSQPSQNYLMDALPNSRLHPSVKPTPILVMLPSSALRRSTMRREMGCHKRLKVFEGECLALVQSVLEQPHLSAERRLCMSAIDLLR
jgi:hypothetical protein